MENKPGHAKLKISGASAGMPVQVIGEDREIRLKDGMLEDNFKGYEVHLYKFSKS